MDEKMEPLRGKVSVVAACNPQMRKHWFDYDMSRKYAHRYHNTKAKNAKAKHRKKFNR